MNVEVIKQPEFDILYNLPEGTNTVVIIGGRGGMKTYEASKYIAFSATVKLKRCAILRDERELVRESILNEILLRYDTANETGILDTRFERQSNGIKDKKTGEMLVFTKGFRASDLQKRANLKSISNVDIALIEEAEDIRDQDKFNTFADSIRKEDSLIIIILNTPDINHWIVKRYFNVKQVEDGFYEIVPKKLKGFVCIQTSYKNNPFLPQHIVDRYEAYGDKNSHLYNPYYYKTAILGYASTGRKGQILTKVKPISLADYMALPFKEYYGQDFGTASPAGLVGVKFDRNNCYARQINYLPMSSLSLGKLYCELNFGVSDRIIGDNADKEAIKKLSNGFEKSELTDELIRLYPKLLKGFYIVPCKNKDISFRISLMDSLNLFAVEESKDLWEEIMNWCYAQDKNGNYTNDPIAGFDHCFVGDTLITTNKGQVKIKDIKVNDLVLTSNGYNKVLSTWNNGLKQTYNYLIELDTFILSLQCTPNHLIKTTQGWIKISELKSGQTVILCSDLMAKNTIYMQMKNIFQKAINECMLLFGNIIMVKFLKLIQYIIRIKTRGITELKILNLLSEKNTCQLTSKKDLKTIKNGLKNFIKKGLPWQPNTTNQKKGENRQKKYLKNIIHLLKLNQHAKNADKHIKLGDLMGQKEQRNFAQKNALQKTDENLGLITSKECVLFAEQHTSLTNIQKQGHVVNCVVRKLQIARNEVKTVYDLTVENEHEYFANGLLVHNCLDGWGYCIVDHYAQSKHGSAQIREFGS